MGKAIDRTGHVYGSLTVIQQVGNRQVGKQTKRFWLCQCECGNRVEVCGDNLGSGTSRSCGCKFTSLRHGHCVGRFSGGKNSPTYTTWTAMINRCLNKKHTAYPRYGGAGVTVCQQWTGDSGFTNFLRDMGERPTGHTLDRIDNSKGYSPDNCRWATTTQQYQNKRVVRDSAGKFTN